MSYRPLARLAAVTVVPYRAQNKQPYARGNSQQWPCAVRRHRHRGANWTLQLPSHASQISMAAQLAKDRPRAYLDLDVDDACAKFKRASHFVESCDLKYALSSKKIDELGGGEILRLPELYANDFEWSAKPMRARPQPNCRVVFELYEDIAPLAVENFLALCRGDRGVDKGSGVKLHYKGCPVHRVVRNFVMQGGDIVKGNGATSPSLSLARPWPAERRLAHRYTAKNSRTRRRRLRLKHDGPACSRWATRAKTRIARSFLLRWRLVPNWTGSMSSSGAFSRAWTSCGPWRLWLGRAKNRRRRW